MINGIGSVERRTFILQEDLLGVEGRLKGRSVTLVEVNLATMSKKEYRQARQLKQIFYKIGSQPLTAHKETMAKLRGRNVENLNVKKKDGREEDFDISDLKEVDDAEYEEEIAEIFSYQVAELHELKSSSALVLAVVSLLKVKKGEIIANKATRIFVEGYTAITEKIIEILQTHREELRQQAKVAALKEIAHRELLTHQYLEWEKIKVAEEWSLNHAIDLGLTISSKAAAAAA